MCAINTDLAAFLTGNIISQNLILLMLLCYPDLHFDVFADKVHCCCWCYYCYYGCMHAAAIFLVATFYCNQLGCNKSTYSKMCDSSSKSGERKTNRNQKQLILFIATSYDAFKKYISIFSCYSFEKSSVLLTCHFIVTI